jgi:hypothetical protein
MFRKRLRCLLTVVMRSVIQAREMTAFDIADFASLSTALLRGKARWPKTNWNERRTRRLVGCRMNAHMRRRVPSCTVMGPAMVVAKREYESVAVAAVVLVMRWYLVYSSSVVRPNSIAKNSARLLRV